MIEQILPAGVRSVESFTDFTAAGLFADELALVAGAGSKRRREFVTGRVCAHRALRALGVAAVPVLRVAGRAPRWPAGVVGSITHCDGYRAAVVARRETVDSVGIDAEPAAALPEGVLALVASPREQLALQGLAALEPAVAWDRLLFCAKEAVFKAWSPLTHRWLGFRDAEVTFQRDGTFHARLVPADRPAGTPAVSPAAALPSPVTLPETPAGLPAEHATESLFEAAAARLVSDGLDGRWMVGNGLLLAAVTTVSSRPVAGIGDHR